MPSIRYIWELVLSRIGVINFFYLKVDMFDCNFDSELVRQIYRVVLFKHDGGYSHEVPDA
jgi:hypothetical protein